MSLRDFDAPFPNDPRALHNEPLGNGSGLENFHTRQPEDIEPSNTPKIIGAVAVALMIGAAGVALYASAGSSMKPKAIVASNTTMPAPVAQPAPAPEPAAMAPDANAPVTPPAAAADNTPEPTAPVKAASVPKKQSVASTDSNNAAPSSDSSAASTRLAADGTQSTVQPQQQPQAITPPSPSPSDVATNNTQSGVAVSPNATSASDIPAPQPNTAQNNSVAPDQATQATPAAPAPDQQAAATPAQPPAQAAGQVNQ